MDVKLTNAVRKKLATTTNKTQSVFNDLVKKHGAIGINSAHRTPAHNKKVGGASNSQHIHRRAIDLPTAGIDPKKRNEILADLARDPRVGGIGLYPSGNIHFDTRPRGKNGSVAIWGANGSYTANPRNAVLNRALKQTPVKIGQNDNVIREGPLGKIVALNNSAPPVKVKQTVEKPRNEWTQEEVELQTATGRVPTKTIEVTQRERDDNNTQQVINNQQQQAVNEQRQRGNFLQVPGVESGNNNIASAVSSQLGGSTRSRSSAMNLFQQMHRNSTTQGEQGVI